MKYVGLQQQIDSNNRKSILLLIAFPFLILALVFAFICIINYQDPEYNYYGGPLFDWDSIIGQFISSIPVVFIAVGIWFIIAYLGHSSMINASAKSHSLARKDNMRIYNLTENLCISVGMKMPKLRIIDSPALNAFASGINDDSYTVTLTQGIIDKLDDDELEGVIAHELAHIRNKDVRLLIISIIFVGIFAFIINAALRMMWYNGALSSRRRDDKGGGAIILLVVAALAALGYFFSIFFKLALSRRREYLADSTAVEMTRNAEGLARALEKISGNDVVDSVKNKDVKQMFISNSEGEYKSNFAGGLAGLFSTHPPIEKRIAFLRQL